MIEVFATPESNQSSPMLTKLRSVLPGFPGLKRFVQRFAATTHIVAHISDVLKNHGLTPKTFETCLHLLDALPQKSKTQQRLRSWLKHHLKIHAQLAVQHAADLSLMVSSDIIESLFGNFKHIIERSPQADMNRATLIIPALCGSMNTT